MESFFVCIGILLIISGVVVSLIFKTKKPDNAKLARIMIPVGVIFFLLGGSFKIVPTGYTGVRTTFGQISEQTVPEGFNLRIPFIQNIQLVNNKRSDVMIPGQIWGETTERTPVFAENVVVTYQISKARSAWLYANVRDVDEGLISSSLTSSAIKSAMVELSASDVTIRSKIEPLAKEKLQESLDEKYGEEAIAIYKVVINNMDFEQAYNDAIQAKSIAQQQYEAQQVENKTAIEKAEADKKVAITKAEAEAESLLIKAKAEADANRLLSESLSDEILESKFYETWNGELPQVMGDDAVITDIRGSAAE